MVRIRKAVCSSDGLHSRDLAMGFDSELVGFRGLDGQKVDSSGLVRSPSLGKYDEGVIGGKTMFACSARNLTNGRSSGTGTGVQTRVQLIQAGKIEIQWHRVLILFINLSGCIPPRYRIQNKEMSGMPRDQITLAKSASAATPAMASSRAWWRRA